MGNIRVHIAMADPSYTAALAAYLAAAADFEIDSDDPDVLVVETSGGAGLASVSQAAGDRTVVAIGEDDPQAMIAALEAGALGYVTTGSSFEQIADSVRQVGRGDGVVPPAMLGALLRHTVHRRRVAQADLDRLELLTPRERQVLELVAMGVDRATVADRLFISPDTVRTHLMRVFRKLDIHSLAEAVAFAARCGIAPQPEENQ